jgi:hypothetical protein
VSFFQKILISHLQWLTRKTKSSTRYTEEDVHAELPRSEEAVDGAQMDGGVPVHPIYAETQKAGCGYAQVEAFVPHCPRVEESPVVYNLR